MGNKRGINEQFLGMEYFLIEGMGNRQQRTEEIQNIKMDNLYGC